MKNTIVLITFLVTGLSLGAQEPGDLYVDFGTAGVYIEKWPDLNTESNDIGVLQDGTLVLAGYLGHTIEYETQVLTAALTNHGEPIAFGNTTCGFEYRFVGCEAASAIEILPDNKILVAGYYYDTHYHPFVIRLFPDGQIDEGFAENGVFRGEHHHMVVVDMDIYQTEDTYYIVLCGQSGDVTGKMMMLNEAGEVEQAFGSCGIVDLRIEGRGSLAKIDIDSENGSLYACAGYSDRSIVLKYQLPGGEPDPDFGGCGIVSYAESEGFLGDINSIIYDQESRCLILFGEYMHAEGDYDIFACCLNADDGSLHPSFGAGGWTSLRSATSKDYLSAAIRQSDGKYYIGGYTNLSGDYDFFIGRMNPNGFADITFGINGLVLTSMGGRNIINALALSPQEDILYATGLLDEGGGNTMVVAAYHTGYHGSTRIDPQPGTDRPVVLFPNPARGKVTIQTGTEDSHRVQVFDLSGNQLFERTFYGCHHDLHLESLPISVYFIKITTPGKQAETFKLIKH